MPGDGAGAVFASSRHACNEGLADQLRALRTAVALLRDPLTGAGEQIALLNSEFRALPKPRTTPGPRSAPAPTQKGRATLTAAGVPQPSEPHEDDAEADDAPGDVINEEVRAIVARAQAGDADAFGELYDRYVDLVYRYIYYRVGAQALAEDLTSETFLRALRRITSFTWQGRDIGAWFVTIARNLIADHFKSGRYRLEVTTADMLDADGVTEGPEGAVLEGITNTTLLEAVKELGAEQQECIVLRFLQGLSVAETALAMGKNEGAIKALQYRAVRALGRLLPEDLL
ncbi:MAG: polymerase sigma-70 factor, subfamily [Frankiales bacterium]|jgi:RNA polymerase sigma-70 factor (ECF subfamily)|nr:polymerase sigma-70 factor, subfamily [Frankiales bacterium]